MGDRVPEDLRRVIEFHGHLCPGLTMGYRAAHIAMEELGVRPGTDEELVGIVENDACGVDAFQYLTGCTMGKGNLVYKDWGKHAFTLARRDTGRGVRVAIRHDVLGRDPEHAALRARVMVGDATEQEREAFWSLHNELALSLAEMPAEQVAIVREAESPPPPTARIFDSVVCATCGESVMEPRSRMRDGAPSCIPCATSYGRGWEVNE